VESIHPPLARKDLMKLHFGLYGLLAGLCLLLADGGAAQAAVTKVFTIREPFGLSWGPDRVNYRVEFPAGEVTPEGLALTDAAGNPVAVQLSDIALWADGKTVKSAALSFMASLQPEEEGRWTLSGDTQAVKQPVTDLTVVEKNGLVELSTRETGVRLPVGTVKFPAPAAAERVPAPLQALRLSDGRWIGKGWWQTDRPCLGYAVTVVEKGPVFARVALRYDFAEGTSYTATVELSAGQDLAIVTEEFNLSQGESYEMPEQPGKPGTRYQYVLPHFDPPGRGLLWDWWGGTHGRVPSPHCYNFSFYEGLQPDRCEWYGRMYHVVPGIQGSHDTPIAYDRDSRWTSINAYLQWSDDESLYFGAYSAQGADEVAIVGLRPSQWIHPDLDPHPVKSLQQFTATNNLWIERRTAPDLYLRAPTCLGRRMYGIGVLHRREGTDKEGKPTVTSDIMLRHVRARGNGLTEDNYNYQLGYLLKGDPETGRQLVDTLLTQLRETVQTTATRDWDHNSYAANMARFACMADVALGVPECTPEQATRMRRYVAAIAYNCLSPDYVPPREAGYAWGTANMMESLRLRGALLNVCLLPNHPQGKTWRSSLAKFLIANTQAKINPAGATLEIGGYGVMGIEFATIPFVALSRTDTQLDMAPVLKRLRAAAHNRLSYLAPYDVRGGFRAPSTIGDSPYVPEYSLPMLAAALRQADPALTRQLIWGIREGGLKMNGWASALPGLLIDPDEPADVPKLHSEFFEGSGMIMRNGFPSREETYLHLNAGAFAIGHGHNDRGGFLMYAQGAPLMVDWGSQYVPHMAAAWLHNGMITFNHDETVRPCPGRGQEGCYYTGGGKVWTEHTVEPFTCLEPAVDPQAENMDEGYGKATAFVSLPAADFGVFTRKFSYLSRVPYMLQDVHQQFMSAGPAEGVWLKEPFTWTRRAAFVKSPTLRGPNYLVLRDDLAGDTELTPALNFWCLADRLDVDGQRATYTGQYGVDLEVYVAEPATFAPVTHRAGHTSGRDFGPYYEKTFGKPFKEEQILLRIPQRPGGGYFTALVPRKAEAAAPTFATVLAGQGLQVTWPDRVDTVILLNQPGKVELEGLSLEGTAFVLTKADGNTMATMLAPGTVKQGGRTLLSGDKPASCVIGA